MQSNIVDLQSMEIKTWIVYVLYYMCILHTFISMVNHILEYNEYVVNCINIFYYICCILKMLHNDIDVVYILFYIYCIGRILCTCIAYYIHVYLW